MYGPLSIAAAKLGATQIVATDIEKEAENDIIRNYLFNFIGSGQLGFKRDDLKLNG